MANPEHMSVLRRGVGAWNSWVADQRLAVGSDFRPELTGADIHGMSLYDVDFLQADLCGAILFDADLRQADLREAVLSDANLQGATLYEADLSQADAQKADLQRTDLCKVNLRQANLRGANLNHAVIGMAALLNLDLSGTRGLESVLHVGPSSLGIDTLYRSQGQIPDEFLRGCGVPEEMIVHLLPLIRAGNAPVQYHSCFISYSHADEEFAERLHSRLRHEKLRVWYAPEDMKGGKKLHEQIFEAIQIHDRLLLVLSDASINSEWVMTEVRKARDTERRELRRKLFPIRLVDFDRLRSWSCFDADSGKDLAVEVRQFFVPDFSDWKNHDSFEKAFQRLLRDLKAEITGKP
jgi:uncharacterized protein YjbI with pentapeptide repeats